MSEIVLTEVEVAGAVLAHLVKVGRVAPGADCEVRSHYDAAGRCRKTVVTVREAPRLRLVTSKEAGGGE